MICPNCGRKNQEHSIFCSHCGYKLAAGKKEPSPIKEDPDLEPSQPVVEGDEPPAPQSGAADASDETVKIPVISEEMIQKKKLEKESYWEEDQEKSRGKESSQDSSESEDGGQDKKQDKKKNQKTPAVVAFFKDLSVKLKAGWERFVHWMKELWKTWTEADFSAEDLASDQPGSGEGGGQDQEGQVGGWKAWFSLDMVIELAVLVICLLLVFIDLPKRMKPAYQAEAFFNKLANGKLEKAYDYMVGDLDRFDPQSLAILADNYDLDELSQASLKMGEEKDGQAQGQVIYRVGAEEKTRSFPIVMKKMEGHKHLFFENWRVSPTPYLIDHYRVRVPAGFKVKWDGKALTADDLDPAGDQDPANKGKDLYLLKGVISGKHTVEARSDLYQTQWVHPQVTGEDMVDVNVQAKEYKDEVFQAMTDQAATNVQRIFTGALAREPFEDLAWLFQSSPESQEEAKKAYYQLVDWLDENRVVKLDISSVACQFNREEGSESGVFPVHIHIQGQATLDQAIFLSLLHREKEVPLDRNYVLNYALEGGEWKQFGMVINFKDL